MKKQRKKKNAGFSLMELLISMTIMLILLGIVASLLSRASVVRQRESARTDALTASQAALNVLSRELANSGFGISSSSDPNTPNNGIILADSTSNQVHFRANIDNTGPTPIPSGATVLATNVAGEDITYFYDSATKSIVRYDPNGSPRTSVVVNKIANVTFSYFDYTGSTSSTTGSATPTANTGRVRITVASSSTRSAASQIRRSNFHIRRNAAKFAIHVESVLKIFSLKWVNYENENETDKNQKQKNERGAAMVMALLVSFMLLVASAGLLMESSMNTQNVTDATAEQQAYNAAESGIQSAVNVLRGNTVPSPLLDSSKPATDAANKITL